VARHDGRDLMPVVQRWRPHRAAARGCPLQGIQGQGIQGAYAVPVRFSGGTTRAAARGCPCKAFRGHECRRIAVPARLSGEAPRARC
jgi:hypothetical protein